MKGLYVFEELEEGIVSGGDEIGLQVWGFSGRMEEGDGGEENWKWWSAIGDDGGLGSP